MNEIQSLLEIMAKLRDPDGGCPWDRAQTFRSIVSHTIEEAYEVADTIERGALHELPDELGDLLFQVVFYAELAKEARLFQFSDVVRSCNDKLIRRHPHVFGDAGAADAASVNRAWEEIKQQERAQRRGERAAGVFDGVAVTLPASSRAVKLQKRAADVGFDWDKLEDIYAKVTEELDELRDLVEAGGSQQDREAELGDLLFACVNLARRLSVDPEQALRAANRKFEARFNHIERRLKERGRTPQESTLREMDALWDEGKRAGL